MAYKMLRNRALRDATRFVTGNDRKTAWYSDTNFATVYPIFDGYKLTKNQTMLDTHPDFSKVFEMHNTGILDFAKIIDTGESTQYGESTIAKVETENGACYVNKKYVDLLESIYPDGLWQHNGHKLSPATIWNDGELVGVIMPLRT